MVAACKKGAKLTEMAGPRAVKKKGLRRTAIDYNTQLYKNSTHTFMALQRERVHNLACMMGMGANWRGASVAGALGLAHTMGLGRAFWVAEKTVCFIVGINIKKGYCITRVAALLRRRRRLAHCSTCLRINDLR